MGLLAYLDRLKIEVRLSFPAIKHGAANQQVGTPTTHYSLKNLKTARLVACRNETLVTGPGTGGSTGWGKMNRNF
jgi:hypothetical protein